MTASVRVETQMMVSTQMITSRMPPLVTRTFLRMMVMMMRRARRISEER
jgi:hypothetical protein